MGAASGEGGRPQAPSRCPQTLPPPPPPDPPLFLLGYFSLKLPAGLASLIRSSPWCIATTPTTHPEPDLRPQRSERGPAG